MGVVGVVGVSSNFKEKVDVNEKVEEVRCYPMKDRGAVCLRRLGFVLPSVVCSIFNVLVDIQKIPELQTREHWYPGYAQYAAIPLLTVFFSVSQELSLIMLRGCFLTIFLHYSYHNYEDLSRFRVLHTLCYRSTSPYYGRV